MRRIALLTPTFSQFSGIDRVVEGMAKRFTAAGDRVTVVCLDGTIEVTGVEVVKLGMPKSPLMERIYRLFFFFDVAKINRTARLLREYDIVYSHFYPMNLIAARAKKHYGRTYWYHNYGIPPRVSFSSFVEQAYIVMLRWLTNRTVRSADRVVSISRYLAEVLKKETGKDSEVEHVEIDRERYHQNIDQTKVRAQHGFGDDPVVLYVGRISPHKGVHLLVDAFKMLLASMPNAHLVIVGKPTFKNYIDHMKATAGDRVHFVGFVPDEELPYYYAAADVYATATLWEGYDMPIAEAQACGIPAVAFDVGPHKEIIDGRGALVPVGDVPALARALQQAIGKRKA